ncbi:MAG TPA: polyprenol monophosphomannose synthase [Acidimicrobiales bacterium]|nr:polyprenol monophosphomannose synthase [Acidimicrobiales bacterium]
MRPLVVLPTYNEAGNVPQVLPRIRAAVPDAEILVVDDNSPDGTAELVETVAAGLGGIQVLRRPGKSGIGNAYRAGFRWGLERGFDAFVEMDADLSHDPAQLPDLLGGLAGADLVIGSRYVPGGSIPNWAPHRRLLSEAGNRYAAVALGMRVRDLTSGFRAYSAATLQDLDLDRIRADGYGFQIEMAFRAHRRGRLVTEVPIRFVDRVEGQSKMSMRIVVEALLLVTLWGVRRLFGGYGRIPARSSGAPGTASAQTVVGQAADVPAPPGPLLAQDG